MRMKKVILFALIAALAAGVLLYFYLGNLEQETVVEVVYEDVLVAAVDIPAYSVITADMVTLTKVPEGTSHPLAARSAAEVVGNVTESLIVEGEEILPVKLKKQGEVDSGMSYVVPDGMRAVTIAVDEVSGVAGFIQRGDYVDIIAFMDIKYLNGIVDETGATITSETTTVQTSLYAAENVCVAAVGTTMQSDSSETDEVLYESITLLLTPEDALRVNLCAKAGVLTVALRSSGDHEINDDVPVTADTFKGGILVSGG